MTFDEYNAFQQRLDKCEDADAVAALIRDAQRTPATSMRESFMDQAVRVFDLHAGNLDDLPDPDEA
jgi:hypothetical protein